MTPLLEIVALTLENRPLTFSVSDGQVTCHWQGENGGQGFTTLPQSPESWQDDFLDELAKGGDSIELCVGRWHSLKRPIADSLVDWLGSLIETSSDAPLVAVAPLGPRSRPSVLAAPERLRLA
jgi:hypothetical protein